MGAQRSRSITVRPHLPRETVPAARSSQGRKPAALRAGSIREAPDDDWSPRTKGCPVGLKHAGATRAVRLAPADRGSCGVRRPRPAAGAAPAVRGEPAGPAPPALWPTRRGAPAGRNRDTRPARRPARGVRWAGGLLVSNPPEHGPRHQATGTNARTAKSVWRLRQGARQSRVPCCGYQPDVDVQRAPPQAAYAP